MEFLQPSVKRMANEKVSTGDHFILYSNLLGKHSFYETSIYLKYFLIHEKSN